jgi:hypothetical protein
VVCGPLQQHGPSPNATALNPVILVEVTSDSSEDYDIGEKLEAYRTIPSLRECIIVSHRERRITVHISWSTDFRSAPSKNSYAVRSSASARGAQATVATHVPRSVGQAEMRGARRRQECQSDMLLPQSR